MTTQPSPADMFTTTYVTRNGHDMYRRETHAPFSGDSMWLCRTCNWCIPAPYSLELRGYDHAKSDAIAEEHMNGPVLEPITPA